MKLKYCITGLILSFITPVIAQNNSTDSTNGIASHKMRDAFIGGGFVLGKSNSGSSIIYGESREFIVGVGIGYKFVKWNGIGIDIYYKSTGFFLKQDSSKTLPNNILHNSEKVSFDNIGGKVFDRFYFGKVFFDGGFYLDWDFYTKHIAWDNFTVANNAGGSSTKTIDRQLVFTNPTNYGLTFRIGATTGIAIFFNYRMSNLFKSGTSYSELPVYVLGVTFGSH